MAWDRFRYIRHPNKARLPAFVCTIGTWLTALCLVLPYPIYIIYVDLGVRTSPFFVQYADSLRFPFLSRKTNAPPSSILRYLYPLFLFVATVAFVRVNSSLQQSFGADAKVNVLTSKVEPGIVEMRCLRSKWINVVETFSTVFSPLNLNKLCRGNSI